MSVSAAFSVTVLDISISGILVESPNRVDPGSRGRLRLSLDGTPVSFDVQIERVSPESGAPAGYRIGARFIGLDVAQRHLLERFVTR